MEELQSLVEMVAKLPQMAIWVIALFWAYKVVVIGSMYGLIRFGVMKLHDYLIQRKVQSVEIRPLIDGMAIKAQLEPMMAQLRRVAGYVNDDSSYIHTNTVEWLRLAIDDKIAKDVTEAREKAKEKISTFAIRPETVI